MKIEIWSDKVCPFCYIGKRKFELALEQLEFKRDVEVIWKSFQLDPEAKHEPGKTVYQSLAEKKGLTVLQARQMTSQVSEVAKEVGLDFNFDIAVTANTFNAHRLSHLAARYGLQNEAEEKLFEAYFVNGKNLEDKPTLTSIGTHLGLAEEEVVGMLNSNAYAKEVQEEIDEASALGVRGVPFFVLNRQYAVSGAQPVEAFLQAIRQAWNEWQKSKPLEVIAGDVAAEACDVNGNCD